MKIYIDFDNTIVESNRRVIELLNDRYNINKTEKDLTDYEYTSIAPITSKEKDSIFECNDFFSKLEFKKGFLDILNKYHNDIEFIVTAKGTEKSLEKKETWVKNNIPYDIRFIGFANNNLKNNIDMEDSIQVNDCLLELNMNAKIKILYKDNNNFKWQNGYENTDVLVVNTWEEIGDILSFYLLYDYNTLDIIK